MMNGGAVTDTAALGAVTSPVWLPWLHSASSLAGEALPVLGGLWLALQIVTRAITLYGWFKAWRATR
jgi:hypothetical protein